MAASQRTVAMLLALMVLAIIAAVSARELTGFTQAALDDEIIDLPDAPAFSRQFSGYVKVGNHTDMFFWLVLAKNDSANKPLLWWSSGGPGCSGLLGMLSEMSAFQPVSDGKGGAKLQIRDYNWNENYNIVYVEQPNVGFTNIDSGYVPREWTDAEIATRNADFLEGFFVKFPNLAKNEFGITSESYGGHYIPTLARELIARINSGRSSINFKWSIVGNPLIYLPMRDYGYYRIMIDRQLIPRYPLGQEYITLCTPDLTKFPNPPAQRPARCEDLESQMDRYTTRVDPYAMSFPKCTGADGLLRPAGHAYGEFVQEMIAKAQNSYRRRTLQDTNELHELQHLTESLMTPNKVATPEDDYFPPNYQSCEEDYVTKYLNRKDVQKALHANLKRGSWSMCADTPYNDFDFIDSMLPVYRDNAIKGPYVKQLIFSGSDDTMCSTTESQMAIFNNFTPTSTFWNTVDYNGQLLGYKTTFSEPKTLTFVTVHGAGHMVPQTRPQFGKAVLERFIQGTL